MSRNRLPRRAAPRAEAFCLACGALVAHDGSACPECGTDPQALSAEPYRRKLLRALGHPLSEVRERAARLLGEVAGPEAFEALLGRARDPTDPFVAAAALQGLERLQERHRELPEIDWAAFDAPGHPAPVRRAAREILSRKLPASGPRFGGASRSEGGELAKRQRKPGLG